VAAASGVECREISVGATPTARFSVAQPDITEMRPGNYAYFDRTQVGLGAAAWDDCALTVLARVVSRPAPDRVILDSGSKTLTNDLARGFAPMPGYGAVFTDVLRVRAGRPARRRAAVGGARQRPCGRRRTGAADRSLVRIIPNHSCVVSNLVDAVWLVDGDSVVERLPVAAPRADHIE
jgi:D-serine deaminase-like pyridoxal phosphate-dependent protein